MQEKGAAYLQSQRELFTPTAWRDAAVGSAGVSGGTSATAACGASGCTASLTMVVPSVVALWVRVAL